VQLTPHLICGAALLRTECSRARRPILLPFGQGLQELEELEELEESLPRDQFWIAQTAQPEQRCDWPCGGEAGEEAQHACPAEPLFLDVSVNLVHPACVEIHGEGMEH